MKKYLFKTTVILILFTSLMSTLLSQTSRTEASRRRIEGSLPDSNTKDTDTISLIEFINADIKDVINFLSDVTGFTIIMDPSVNGKISIQQKEKITVEEALEIIKHLLNTQGYTLEREGNLLRIIPIKDKTRNLYENINDVKQIQNLNEIITYIYSLENVNGEDIIKTIKQFQSKYGNIIHDRTSKKLLITDFVKNILQIYDVIIKLDLSIVGQKASEIIILKYISIDKAIEIITPMLPDVFIEDKRDTRYQSSKITRPTPRRPGTKDEPKVQIIDMERNDRFILAGDREEVFKIKKLIEEIDVKFRETSKVNYEIIKLNMLSTDEMLDILKKILYGEESTQGRRTAPVPTGTKKGFFKLVGTIDFMPIPGKKYLIIIGEDEDRKRVKDLIKELEMSFSKEEITATSRIIRIFPIQYVKSRDIVNALTQIKQTTSKNLDEDNDIINTDVYVIDYPRENSIIVKAPLQKFTHIEDLINKLDKRGTQVLVEVKVIEVKYNNERKFGIDYNNLSLRNFVNKQALASGSLKGYGDLVKGQASFNGFSTSAIPAPDADNPGLFIWNINDPSLVINTLSSIATLNVLSTPNLLTINNKPAKISVTDKKAIAKEELQIPPNNSNDDVRILKTYEYKDAGLTLTVTPHINDSDNVTMEIKQEVNDFNESGNPGYPDITTRTIENEIIVANKTTAIIGGLIKDSTSITEKGVPYLMDIPLLGNLFKYQRKVKNKVELLVFITPHIIVNDEELKALSNKKLMDSIFSSTKKPVNKKELRQLKKSIKKEKKAREKAEKITIKSRLKRDKLKETPAVDSIK